MEYDAEMERAEAKRIKDMTDRMLRPQQGDIDRQRTVLQPSACRPVCYCPMMPNAHVHLDATP